MTELTMPRLSDSMEEGTILSWLKRNGERVHAGEDLLEIESDKATVTHPADADGILEILVSEGTSVPVGAPIARLGEAAPAVRDEAPAGSSAVAIPGAAATAVASDLTRDGAGIKATPLARRVARVHRVRLEDVTGSGPRGRITRADVLAKAGIARESAPVAPPKPAAAAPPSARPDAKGETQVVELSRLQSVVARRMAEAKATVPHFQVQTEVAMDAAIAFREQLKATVAFAPSLNDLIVKAAALALRAHPMANGAYRDGRFELYSRVNVGVAVATEGALVVPTIFDADQKSLGAIAADSSRLIARVREGAITPPELAGATFTVSNLGMYGMTAITPVVNVPQAAILGVGATRMVLGRDESGAIVDRHVMTLTLSCDHRILYGAEAAQFLSAIREALQTPLRLAVGM